MKPLRPLVLGVLNSLKDHSLFGDPPYDIKAIRSAVQALCGDIPIEFRGVDYKVSAVGGWLEFYERSSGVYGEVEKVALIRFAKEHNLCWRRFIQVKEMCHLWIDEASAHTDTPAKYQGLIERLATADLAALQHDDFQAEQLATLAAAEILLPEEWHKQFQRHYDEGNISALRLALMFRLPVYFVARMMTRRWQTTAHALIYA